MSIGATRALPSAAEVVFADAGKTLSPRVQLANGLAAEVVRGEREIARYNECLDGFISGCRDNGVWSGAGAWLRDAVAQDGIPMAVLLYRGQALVAVALGAEVTVWRRRTRMGVCGNLTGQRGFFTTPGVGQAEREALALSAADAMMSLGLAGMVLKLRDISSNVEAGACRSAAGKWSATFACKSRKVSDTFRLGDSFNGSLSKFGAHTRRNLRYYRRRVERDLEGEFLPEMQGQLLREAIVELQSNTNDPVPSGVAKNRIAQVARNPQAFCMGMRTGDGRWLSWISGWRSGRHTYIDWQCNRSDLQRYSLSTVMRAFLLEHESLLRQSHVHFLGGTSHSMHFGFREERCTDWLLTRRGAVGLLLRSGTPVLRLMARWMRPRTLAQRSPLREFLQRMASAVTKVSGG